MTDEKTDKKKAIIYTRFSPRPNAAESLSCETQLAYCEQQAHNKGYEIAGVFNDRDVSGAEEDRPKLWAAIDALKKGSVLLVMKLDRLARNVYLMELIRRAVETAGATIEAVTGDVEGDGPESKMIRQVLAAIAEYERRIIAIRTSMAMRRHQKEGKRMGRFAPYGWSLGESGKLIENEAEQEALKTIIEMVKEGHPRASIYRRLNLTHKKAARGKKWDYGTVSRIIRRLGTLSA